MENPPPSSGDIRSLQRCVNDLVSLLALPALWSGAELIQIANTLSHALLGMLQLDVVGVILNESAGRSPIEMVQVAPWRKPAPELEAACTEMGRSLRDQPRPWPAVTRKPAGTEEISIVPLPLGLEGEFGLVTAGSQRAEFPDQMEKLLLSVAVNQALIGLQQAQLLRAEKQMSADLDARVAQRTQELAWANEELRGEIDKRIEVEEKLRNEETELRRSEARWRSVFENSAVGVALTDLNGNFLATNPVYEQILGYSEKELQSLSFLGVTVELFVEPVRNLLGELIAGTRREFQIEKQYRRRDGSPIWVRKNVSLVPGTEGVPQFLMAIVEDISDRKQAEEAIRANERNLDSIINTMPTTAWSTRPDGYCEFLNQRWLDYAGMSADQAHGWGWTTVIHPDDRDRFMEYWQASLATGTPVDTETRMRRFDGAWRWFLLRAHALRDESGNIVKWYGTNTDIDDRKLAEEALVRARAELAHMTRATSLGVLTASIAHEVNQPLSGIVTNASTCLRMLNADPPNVEGARETARRTIRDGNRASDVITRLRTLFGRKEIAAEALDLNDAVREVIALSLTEWQSNRVILREELTDDLPPVRGDRVQLQQVILNLLKNASDAMTTVDDRPRELLIRTERDQDNRVRLSVRDVGVGFDPQQADRLFDGFYTTKSDGMGIGLSVSRSIIEAHEGRLWATLNDGPGSTFTFSIPHHDAASADLVAAPPAMRTLT